MGIPALSTRGPSLARGQAAAAHLHQQLCIVGGGPGSAGAEAAAALPRARKGPRVDCASMLMHVVRDSLLGMPGPCHPPTESWEAWLWAFLFGSCARRGYVPRVAAAANGKASCAHREESKSPLTATTFTPLLLSRRNGPRALTFVFQNLKMNHFCHTRFCGDEIRAPSLNCSKG